MARFSIEDTGPHLLIEIDLDRQESPEHAEPANRFDEIVPGRLWGSYTKSGKLVALTMRALKDSHCPLLDSAAARRLQDELGKDGIDAFRREYSEFATNVGKLVSSLAAA